MNAPLTKQSNMSKEKTWSISQEKDGITKSLRVEGVENGFIITKSKHGYNESDKGENYIDETKKYISTKNPLEGKEENIKSPMSREDMYSFLDGDIV
jgi:hypothetical protein